MGFDRVRAVARALMLGLAGGMATLAAANGLYASATLAALVVLWLAALAFVDAAPPAPFPPPPPPIVPGAEDGRRLTAYLDLSPAPLVALGDGDRVRAVNRAARRLLDASDLVAEAPRVLLDGLADTRPGSTTIIDLHAAGGVRRFALTTADLALRGAVTRIGALIDIGAELKAAEATALRDLVQVLSHEIVNALTPIASLAQTARAMLDDAVPPLDDIRDAIDTVARRAAGLHRFGESYRALARLPAPTSARVPVARLARDLERLFVTRWPDIALVVDIAQAPAQIVADGDQLVAALWAVLQNAAEALAETRDPRVRLAIGARVGGTDIVIDDNGPGIRDADAIDVFRPFFTTKAAGTGVGLALARQIMRGHGGDLVLLASAPGATVFAARLP